MMPFKAPRICRCGKLVAYGVMCACQIAAKRDADARRPSASSRGYGGAWQKARAGFLQSHPNCAMCGGTAAVVDHIKPHRNDIRLFWEKSNWQSLCTFHHNSTKQSLEKQSIKGNYSA